MPRVACVVLENLIKNFRGAKGEAIGAVRGVNLSVADGELLTLVGPTGCGKTTLLRLIAGLDSPSGGKVLLGGRDVTDVPPKDRDVAMVFQSHALYPHLTAYENIAFGLKLRKHPPADIEREVRGAADLLSLADCLDRRPAELSGGQRQRVALARAVVRRPRVFLLDEPLSNLDVPLRIQMRAVIANLHQRLGVSMLLVTHDQGEAMALGTRLAVMQEGMLQQVGEPSRVYRQPENVFVARFIGTPPMNFLPGRIETHAGHIRLCAQGAAASPSESAGFKVHVPAAAAAGLACWAGKPVILGLRPEHIVCAGSSSALPQDERVEARIEAAEMTGPDLYARLAVHGHSLTARWPAETPVSIGQSLTVHFDMRHANYFDPQTEQLIA